MSVDANCFSGPVVAASEHGVLNVLLLCSAFEVVWADAFRVVADVSYDRRPVEVGDVERETVDCPVFTPDVEVAVAVAPP